MDETIRITRDELYEEVWAEPMSKLARKYGLSDVGLSKICKRLDIPVPWRGYWRRKETGQKVAPPKLRKLPATADASMREVTLRRGSPSGMAEEMGPAADQRCYEADPANRVDVPELLQDPHPLVAQTVAALRKAKTDSEGFLVPARQPSLAVHVTLGSADRTMCIFDTLIKALESRGYRTVVTEGDPVATQVCIGEERIGIAIDEKVDRVEKAKPVSMGRSQYSWHAPEYDYIPTGKLALRIDQSYLGVRGKWADGKQQRLENCLNAFIVGLVVAAEAMRAQRLAREAWHREWEEVERQRQEQARRREEEAARVRALDIALNEWHKSRAIREYVADLRKAIQVTDTSGEETPLIEWIRWAEEYATRIDPFLPVPTVPADPGPPRFTSW